LNACNWFEIYGLKDAATALEFLMAGMVKALDVVSPVKVIKTRKGANLYLRADTLAAMRERDLAIGTRYKQLRNKVLSMVKRDKVLSNMSVLTR
jgi:hypothetical protein